MEGRALMTVIDGPDHSNRKIPLDRSLDGRQTPPHLPFRIRSKETCNADRWRPYPRVRPPGRGGDSSMDKAFARITDKSDAGKWKVDLLLAEGLHLRLPDRDRRVRQAEPRISATATPSSRRVDRQRVRPPRLAPPAPGPEDLPFPMLADIKRELSSALGILDRKEGVALRATFIVDPDGVIRFASVNDLNVGRNRRRGAAGARRAADRRALPVQLEEGRRVPEGRLSPGRGSGAASSPSPA